MRGNRIVWLFLLLLATANCIFSQTFVGIYILCLLVGIPLCSMALTAVLCRVGAIQVETQEIAQKGQVGQCRIAVGKGKWLSPGKIRLGVVLFNQLTGEEQKKTYDTYGGGVLTFDVQDAFCGSLQVRIPSYTVYDWFGLYRKEFSCQEEDSMLVMPEIFSMSLELAQSALSNADSIEYSNVKPGWDPSEVFAIREYVEGDSIRNIHWKLSSKFDDVIVKLPSLPLENSILVMLERIHEEERTCGQESALAEIFVTISESLIHEQILHQVAWYDKKEDRIIAFSVETEEDIPSILPRLLESQPEESREKTLSRYIEETGGFDKAHLVYVSSAPSEEVEMLRPDVQVTGVFCSRDGDLACDDRYNSVFTCSVEGFREELDHIVI